MHRNLVAVMAGKLHSLGKKLWINLGADYDTADAVQADIVRTADAINIEFFVGREGVQQPVATGADWLRQVNFLQAVEQSGKQLHAHVSSVTQAVVDYGFGSWLMGTRFLGSFSASLDYSGAIQRPTPSLVTRAQALGNTTGPMVPVGSLYRRGFEHGSVEINPSNLGVDGLPARAWRIV